MFAFAVAAAFRDGYFCEQKTATMARGFPVAPADGIETANAPHASAAVLRWKVVKRDLGATPRWNGITQLLFAGDVRLYNRLDVIRSLGLSSDGDEHSDLDVALAAYHQWGQDSPKHLVGDFAFVVWNEKERSLFAARDQLGVRPLYYRIEPAGVLLASDVRQILPLMSRPYDDVNASRILDRFTPSGARHAGKTYFRSISLLLPGHSLVVTEGRHHETRYWMPPSFSTQSPSYEENCEELLRLFRRAVRDRLESDHPIVAHSSGGFDSSTIICAANEIYRTEKQRPSLILLSALARGFPCDDSHYMDAVASRVPFEKVTWSALESPPLDADSVSLAYPGFPQGLAGGPRTDLAVANERGARVLLAGVGGDDVLLAGGVFLDMFRHGHWIKLGRETLVVRRPLTRGGRLLLKSLIGALAPYPALRLQANWMGRRPPAPDWFGPVLKEMYPQAPDSPDDVQSTHHWPSHTQLGLWARVTSGRFAGAIRGSTLYAAERGVESRIPYADVRLIEYLLTIPWHQRLPAGHLRRTGRDALGGLLPPEFRKRVSQGPWTAVWERNAQRSLSLISDVLTRGLWLSAPFVSRTMAQAILRRAIEQGPEVDHRRWTLLLDFTAVETWLRRLICYYPAHEVDRCQRV